MYNPAFRTYLENKILTASPEQLQLMLYEGAIRFTNVARMGLEEKDLTKANDAFERVDAILDELRAGLRPEVEPDLCDKFAALYNFCSRQLQEANFHHRVEPLDNALRILQHLRETWILMLEQLARERAEVAESQGAGLASSMAV